MSNPNIDGEDIDRIVEQKIAQDGLTKDCRNLVCDAYQEQQIAEDDQQTWECFESALEECHKEEED
jgi:hypothetical protein